MKKFVCFLLLMFSVVCFTCCSNKGDYVTFGVVGPFTGSLSTYGNSVKNGVLLAVDDLNNNGGVLGKEVRCLCEDDGGDSSKVVTAYSKIVDDIDFLIGEVTSGNSELLAPTINKDKVPTLTPSATADSVTKNREYMFRTCFLDPDQGEVMAVFAKDNLNANTICVVYDEADDYSKGVAMAFINKANALGMNVVYKDGGLKASDNSMRTSIALKVATKDADCVFAPVYYEDASAFCLLLRNNNYTKPLLGADGYDGIIGQLEGTKNVKVANNVFFSNHYCATEDNIKEFTKKYYEKFHENPTGFAALAYDSVMMAAKAMENANSTDKELVRNELANLEFKNGLTGDITFDKNGDPNKSICIIEYVDGEQKLKTKINKNA